MRTVTSVEAQNKFGELLDNAQRELVTITRRGRPVAFVLSPADMSELMDVRQRREKNVADFEAFFALSEAKLTTSAHVLNEADVNRMVNEVR
jgi:prevent-host-death family protein